MSAPMEATRSAICSRVIRTFKSAMAIHVKLKHLALGIRCLLSQMPVGQCGLPKTTTMNLNGIKLTWLGHATFLIETPAGKTILVDPWVMRNPMCPEKEKDIKKVDVMLCTHGHLDHIGDAVEIAKKHTPGIVAIPELGHWLERKGVKQVSAMNKGGT